MYIVHLQPYTMKSKASKGLLLLLFTVLFNYLFWQEDAGLNLLLFTAAINLLLFYLYPEIRSKRAAWLVAIGSLLGALATVIFNSGISKIATVVSIGLLNGFAMFPAAKSIISAFAATITNLCGGFMVGLFKHYEADERFSGAEPETAPKPRKWKRVVKLAVIPIIITVVFYFIFAMANPVFAKIAEQFNDFIINIFDRLFSGWTIERIGFTLLGTYLVGTMLYHWLPEFFPPAETNLDNAATPRENESSFISWLGLQGIKDETLVGIITLVMVNLLILALNIIDISTLWFKFNYQDGMDLSSLVHVGTYWLIFSILLAMAILMYLFRGNQNFNTNNKVLKALTYTWILQNTIMVISVVIRNYHYIENHGLTYKRIGVYTFLLMTVLGLVTLIFKIGQKRSNFFLWRINTWLAYGLLLVASFCNWDYFIACSNIHTVKAQTLPDYQPKKRKVKTDKVDMDYLLSLSDKALPALLTHPKFEEPYYIGTSGTLKELVKYRYQRMSSRVGQRSWLSYNFADAKALQELEAYFTAHPEMPTADSLDAPVIEEIDVNLDSTENSPIR
ncbi:hypothetical protein BH09BAC1_BH09BAC1_09310 [soil metagenome]